MAIKAIQTVATSPVIAALFAACDAANAEAERHEREVLDAVENAGLDERLPHVAANNDLNDAWVSAMYDVCQHPVETTQDLRAKLAFMVEFEMGDGQDWLATILDDAQRIAPEESKDAVLLAHWEARQRCYAQMTAEGGYYNSETAAPALANEHDDHETKVIETHAHTAEGALVQAWVAWEAQGSVFNDDDRARHELIHAADFDALEAIEQRKELDWNDSAMLAVIRTLRTLSGKA
jgi:hypothetical protein